jgi:hypothetical protein
MFRRNSGPVRLSDRRRKGRAIRDQDEKESRRPNFA